MNILIDIGHPAQVHNFKYVYWELEKRQHKVLFIAKNKDITEHLMKTYHLNYVLLGKRQNRLASKFLLLTRDILVFAKTLLSFKPDIVLSRLSLHSSIVLKLFRIPHVGLSDTESSFMLPSLPDCIITSTSFFRNFGKKQLRFPGNIELFYLHKNRYKPDDSILSTMRLTRNDKYVIVRFVSWSAHHDIGLKGITTENKIKLVRELSKHSKVLISSEDELPSELKQYRANIPIDRIHDAINWASLLVGESATMASEAAVLGVPSVYIDEVGRGYTDCEGEAGLVFNYKPCNQIEAIEKAIELIKMGNINIFKEKRDHFLCDKIDPTAFLVWFVENWPRSKLLVSDSISFWQQFK
jgi:predicted glycosyltransferase